MSENSVIEDTNLSNTDQNSAELAEDAEPNLIALIRQVSSQFSGPLPPPGILREYDEIVPGSAQKIIDRFEKQSDHRMGLEREVVTSDIGRSKLGLLAGFILSLVAIVFGCVLVLPDHDTAGAIVATSSVAALAGVFVYGTHSRRQERADKHRSSQPPIGPERE